ncbi:MAG TPA: DUF1573 domain-containing protein [Gemmatales bacterium]|nr:DUF1573 domain-containing protein [Gemmatales bacterium]
MFRLMLPFLLLQFSFPSLATASNTLLQFEETVKDLGGAPRGTKLIHHFKCTNVSQQIVHIAGARTSCHCSTARAIKPELNPGESTSILVEVNTILYSGSRDFTIYVPTSQKPACC